MGQYEPLIPAEGIGGLSWLPRLYTGQGVFQSYIASKDRCRILFDVVERLTRVELPASENEGDFLGRLQILWQSLPA